MTDELILWLSFTNDEEIHGVFKRQPITIKWQDLVDQSLDPKMIVHLKKEWANKLRKFADTIDEICDEVEEIKKIRMEIINN